MEWSSQLVITQKAWVLGISNFPLFSLFGKMQGFWKVGRLARVLRNPSPILLNSERLHSSTIHAIDASYSSSLWRCHPTNLLSSSHSGFHSTSLSLSLPRYTLTCESVIEEITFCCEISNTEVECNWNTKLWIHLKSQWLIQLSEIWELVFANVLYKLKVAWDCNFCRKEIIIFGLFVLSM